MDHPEFGNWLREQIAKLPRYRMSNTTDADGNAFKTDLSDEGDWVHVDDLGALIAKLDVRTVLQFTTDPDTSAETLSEVVALIDEGTESEHGPQS